MALKAGRPVEGKIEDLPRQFIREHKFSDGVIHKWHYDLDKSPYGPILVEMFYPDGYFEDEEEIKREENKQYFNPATGRYVAKFRAKQLGLI